MYLPGLLAPFGDVVDYSINSGVLELAMCALLRKKMSLRFLTEYKLVCSAVRD